jgi:hypothetical protein
VICCGVLCMISPTRQAIQELARLAGSLAQCGCHGQMLLDCVQHTRNAAVVLSLQGVAPWAQTAEPLRLRQGSMGVCSAQQWCHAHGACQHGAAFVCMDQGTTLSTAHDETSQAR